MKHFITAILMFSFFSVAYAQKKKKPEFCGWRYTDTAVIRHQFEKQLAFLRINDHDTIVDIGSSSGSLEGCLSVIGDFTKVNFVLVDIDKGCLNTEKVNTMRTYYAALKGRPDEQQYTIVNNTVDSLYLPANTYRKVWLMNTLHEIYPQQKMAKDIASITQPGGELVILEVLSRPGHTVHGGCHHPLMDEQQIKNLFEQNGFTQTEVLWNPTNAKKWVNPYYMVRFVKN